mgnify:CR=1 FL=1
MIQFSSFTFIFVFFPCVLICYHALRTRGMHDRAFEWLILCSIIYYGSANFMNLPVLLASIAYNFVVAHRIGSARDSDVGVFNCDRRKLWLTLGISGNLMLLGYYKYFDALPLGISFFTLLQVIYLVDCYERILAPLNVREHALVATFFPTVLMGPILRTRDFIPQVRLSYDALTVDRLISSTFLFSIGLFKKVVLADSFAIVVDAGYASPSTLTMAEAWLCTIAYCFQLYFDFSGYSDMAVAAAMMLGFSIPNNFNSPYKAFSIVDFWKRWHISLSTFITTYLYTTIIRSLKKATFTQAMWVTFMTMIIVGIWHGSTINFVVFGVIHGIGLVVNQVWKKYKMPLPLFPAQLLTFMYVNFSFVFFRARTFQDSVDVSWSLINFNGPVALGSLGLATSTQLIIAGPVIFGTALIFLKTNSINLVNNFKPSLMNCCWAISAALISFVYINSNMAKEFIYYDF